MQTFIRNPWSSSKDLQKPKESKKVDKYENPLCPSCGVCYATEPHTCPFREELNGDYQTKCTCCSDCEHECAMDI